MRRIAVCARAMLLLIVGTVFTGHVVAQEKSVKPGINDSFRNPVPAEFLSKFETESREVYSRRQEIVSACQLAPGLAVADIGAGTGLFTRLFSEAVGQEGQVIAVDIAQSFLDHIAQSCRALGLRNVDTVLCQTDSTELPPNSVDVAFICDTYHHFEYPQKTMVSLFKALRSGGRVIVIDFRRIPGQSTDWVLNHVRAGQEVVESEIEQAGFRKTREGELLKENFFVEFTKGKSAGLQPLQFPVIADYGGVVPLPNAAEQPRAGAKLIFDTTAAAPVRGVNKGLERAARLLNLYGAASLRATDVHLTVVLHGEATRSILTDAAYTSHFGVETNPNLPLIRELQNAGVEVFVCGQALNYKEFPETEVAAHISIAAAALTVIANRQADGYSYVPIP